jgi:hypothetical protein
LKKPTNSNVFFPSEEDFNENDPLTMNDKKKKRQISYWTKEEKDAFVIMYGEHGRDWKHIADVIGTKSQNQVKNFFQNYKVKLGLTVTIDGKKKEDDDDATTPPAGGSFKKTILPQAMNKPRIAPMQMSKDDKEAGLVLQMMQNDMRMKKEGLKQEDEGPEEESPNTPQDEMEQE